MPIDLKKEIKLSDLFRRRGGPSPEDAAVEETPKPEKEKKARKSFSFARGPKEPKAPRARKERVKVVALKAAPPPPAVPLMRAFNLMPKETDREKTSASPAFTKVAVALLGVLVLAGLGAGYMTMGARVADRQAKVDEARARLADVTAQAGPAEADNTASFAGEAQARTAALADALGSRVAWDRILREFSLVLPDDVVLVTLGAGSGAADAAQAPVDPAAAAAGASLTISGTAPDQETVAVLLSRLSVIPEFSDVQLQSSARGSEDGGAGSYQFSIVAMIAPEGEETS